MFCSRHNPPVAAAAALLLLVLLPHSSITCLLPRRSIVWLQDNVKIFPTVEARRVLEEGLGRPVDTVFEWLSEDPIAAASLGQVRSVMHMQDLRITSAVTFSHRLQSVPSGHMRATPTHGLWCSITTGSMSLDAGSAGLPWQDAARVGRD